jgi:MFS family permease
MRFILGFLSGLLGALAGWSALAALVIMLAGPDRDGGIAMGAFFGIGPIGGVAGLIAGIWLFVRFGLVRSATPQPPAETSDAAPRRARRLSAPFAATVLLTVAVLGYWGWYELIRSPTLSHGFMTLAIEFRLPPGMSLPDNGEDVHIEIEEAKGYADPMLPANWRAHDGDRRAIIAWTLLMYKTRHRAVSLTLPDVPTQRWSIDLPSDPDPTPGFSPWRVASEPSQAKIEMHFRLSADR